MNDTLQENTAADAKPRRARNVRERRTSEILDAAELEFAKSGFEGTPVQAVANRAGLQKRQILYFYQNKENLYRAVIDRIFTEWRSQELNKWEGEPRQIICDYIDHMFSLIEEKPHRSKLVINEMMRGGEIGIPVMEDRNSRSAMEATVQRLQRWMDKGLMRKTDPLQFIFMLWSFQHFYVAFEPEVAFFLDKKTLQKGDWAMIRRHVKAAAMDYFTAP